MDKNLTTGFYSSTQNDDNWLDDLLEKFKNNLTKNKTEIPLFWVNFDYKKYKEFGKEGSCMAHVHPTLKDDVYVKETLNDLIDYIRDNYKMEEM
jgi:hypothetical protein